MPRTSANTSRSASGNFEGKVPSSILPGVVAYFFRLPTLCEEWTLANLGHAAVFCLSSCTIEIGRVSKSRGIQECMCPQINGTVQNGPGMSPKFVQKRLGEMGRGRGGEGCGASRQSCGQDGPQ